MMENKNDLNQPSSALVGRRSFIGFRGPTAARRRDAKFPTGLYSNHSMTGVALTLNWSALEPKQGQYNWSYFDNAIAQAVQNGRQVGLAVLAGAYSPSWLYKAGAAKFQLRWYIPSQFTECSMQTLPLPWDPVFLSNFTRMIAALGARYAGNPAVTMVGLTGINSVTGEMLLAYSAGTHSVGGGLCGAAPIAPVSAWKSAGYLPSKVTSAWSSIVAAYVAAFPTQQLVVATGSWGFPPIDNTGAIISGSSGDMQEVLTLDGIGAQLVGARYVLQNDGLSVGYTYPRPSTVPADTLLSYSTKVRVTTDTACADNGYVTPCDPVAMMTTMMANATAAGAEFIDLYPDDIMNPALAGAIASFGE
jgi:hypothetical protein